MIYSCDVMWCIGKERNYFSLKYFQGTLSISSCDLSSSPDNRIKTGRKNFELLVQCRKYFVISKNNQTTTGKASRRWATGWCGAALLPTGLQEPAAASALSWWRLDQLCHRPDDVLATVHHRHLHQDPLHPLLQVHRLRGELEPWCVCIPHVLY